MRWWSLPRHCRTTSGKPKDCFRTFDDARQALLTRIQEHDEHLYCRVYHCSHCYNYHIGHRKGWDYDARRMGR